MPAEGTNSGEKCSRDYNSVLKTFKLDSKIETPGYSMENLIRPTNTAKTNTHMDQCKNQFHFRQSSDVLHKNIQNSQQLAHQHQKQQQMLKSQNYQQKQEQQYSEKQDHLWPNHLESDKYIKMDDINNFNISSCSHPHFSSKFRRSTECNISNKRSLSKMEAIPEFQRRLLGCSAGEYFSSDQDPNWSTTDVDQEHISDQPGDNNNSSWSYSTSYGYRPNPSSIASVKNSKSADDDDNYSNNNNTIAVCELCDNDKKDHNINLCHQDGKLRFCSGYSSQFFNSRWIQGFLFLLSLSMLSICSAHPSYVSTNDITFPDQRQGEYGLMK